MEIMYIISAVIIVLNLITLYYVRKPKIIEIDKDRPGLKRQMIMTPAGTFEHIKQRDPVYNDDETLFFREDGEREG